MRRFLLVPAIILLLLTAACGGADSYTETFDEAGSWRVGDESDVIGVVEDGVYRFTVDVGSGLFWTTPDKAFTNGRYSVDVTKIDGPEGNGGYGLMIRVDEENDSFYALEIDSDGFVWAGRCFQACASDGTPDNGNDNQVSLIGDDWFVSPAVKTGLNETNELSIEANSANLVFYINDIEIGRVTDPFLRSGDVGLIVETLGLPGLVVEFDNLKVEPLP